MDDLIYLVALHTVDGLGTVRLKRLIDFFENPKNIWYAKPKDIQKIGIPEFAVKNLENKRKSLDPYSYFDQITKNGIKVLTFFDKDYPERLKQIYDPPLILYYIGEFSSQDKNAFAIVGTRKVSGYGRTVTEQLTEELVNAGLTVVSGLARGVDTVAHSTALQKGGRTIAVLAGGLNVIYPPENSSLASKIADGRGVVLSEFPPDYPHLPGNFPTRNRIISGLSLGVLVTEAAEDSGSLITARQALEQGREVFAVPGPITSALSLGPAALIKEGAKLVTSVEDILEDIGIETREKRIEISLENLSETEQAIFLSLENESKHIDEVCRELKKPSAEVSASLIKMEIMGFVQSLGSGVYAVKKK